MVRYPQRRFPRLVLLFLRFVVCADCVFSLSIVQGKYLISIVPVLFLYELQLVLGVHDNAIAENLNLRICERVFRQFFNCTVCLQFFYQVPVDLVHT